jgi:hypothetical protein
MTVDEIDVEKQCWAADDYVTDTTTVIESGSKRNLSREAVFELNQEAHDPPLRSLLEGW